MKAIGLLLVVAAFAVYIYFDTKKAEDRGSRLRSLGAIAIIFIVLTALSSNPRKVHF